jgi:hypothetical protein
MKSASSQGASLFHDPNDFSSCPIHTIAVAIGMQSSPSEFVIDHIPRDTSAVAPPDLTSLALRELLEAQASGSSSGEADPEPAPTKNEAVSVPGIHAYVNRVLQKWSKICSENGVTLTKRLSSHSFRRGAAQLANGDCEISTPWIMDRGGWSLSSMSKAFNYIVSTTHEDQAVGKTLAGWGGAKAKARLPILAAFDPLVTRRIRRLQDILFSTAQGFKGPLVLNDDVVEVLMAVVILRYDAMLKVAPNSPYITRVQNALSQLQMADTEL